MTRMASLSSQRVCYVCYQNVFTSGFPHSGLHSTLLVINDHFSIHIRIQLI